MTVAPLNPEPSDSRFEVFDARDDRHLGWLAFPSERRAFVLGRTSSQADLSMEPFLDPASNILYPKQVELRFGGLHERVWSVTAQRGFRRGFRLATVLNGTVLSIQAGPQPLGPDDVLQIGPFRLRLEQDLAQDLASRVDPKDLVQDIEKILTAFVLRWDPSSKHLSEFLRPHDRPTSDWNAATFTHKLRAIADVSPDLDERFRQAFRSEQDLIDRSVRIRNIRNDVAQGHTPCGEDRSELARFWMDLTLSGIGR